MYTSMAKSYLLLAFLALLFSCSSDKESVESLDMKDQTSEVNLFDCYDGNQRKMTHCSKREMMHYDSILNVRYTSLLQYFDDNSIEESGTEDSGSSKSSKTLRDLVIQSQRNWLKSRNANKNVQRKLYEGGSIMRMSMNMQVTSDTKHRIQFLDELIESVSR